MARQKVKKGSKEPRSDAQFEGLSGCERDRYEKAVRVVGRLRRGDGRESVTRAARAEGTTPQTVLRYAGSAFERNGDRGRLHVVKGDRLVRRVKLRTPKGARVVTVTGSRQASMISRYNRAIDRYLAGDIDALIPFRDRHVGGFVFETDADAIERAALAGEINFEEFYALTSTR